jgi:hypothetical protein
LFLPSQNLQKIDCVYIYLATKALLALSAQPHTHVYVISGRSRADLTARFPDAPTLGLVAEHGIFVRHPSRDGRPGAWLLTGPSSDTPAGEPGSGTSRILFLFFLFLYHRSAF